MKTLFTERLILRAPRMEDAEAITCLLRDKRIVDMMSRIPWPYDRKDALEWIARETERRAAGRAEGFAITLREGGELAGVIGLHPDAEAPWACFGYWLGVAHWGRGYATEALREILRFGFEELRLRRIEACHFGQNPASGRVMRKAGLNYEGTQRLRIRKGGQLFDRVLYGLIDEEWRAAVKGPVH